MKTTAAKAAKAPAAERIAHMRDPVRRGAGLGQGVLQLQRAAGNGAVNSLLGGLEPSLDDGVLLLEGPAVDALLSSSNARAAARGNQIAGERGAFNGSEGRRRLAHEAAHVLQQRSNGLAEGTPEEIEADADRYADARVAGLPARVAYQSPVDWHFDDKTDKLPDVSNQFKYETRKVGKETVKTVSGRLWKPGSVKTHRDPDEQRRVSSGTGEDAGHLIGNRFGAAGGEKNLSRQNWMQNRYGTFKDLENQWADKLGRGYSIIASVSDYFKEGEERPYKRVVVWTEVTPDGKQQDFRMTYGNFESVRSREAQAKKEEAKQGEAPKPEAKKAEAKEGGAEAENAANPPPRPLLSSRFPPTFAPDAPANQAANDPVFPRVANCGSAPHQIALPGSSRAADRHRPAWPGGSGRGKGLACRRGGRRGREGYSERYLRRN